MFILFDSFNNKVLSRHRTLENSIKAKSKVLKNVKKWNGNNSYLPMDIFELVNKEMVKVDDQRIYQSEVNLDKF